MAKFTWHTRAVPGGLPVRQVYGFLFAPDGRVLIRVDGAKHSLPGGRPEPGESAYVDILRRETYEEVTLDIAEPHYLGYQCVDDGHSPYAQVRMVAEISRVHPPEPDPDNGRTYLRLLVHPGKAGDLLNWGETGHQQAAAAANAAIAVLGLPHQGLPDSGYL
ncbi:MULTISPECIES: NUDIX hydrolase [Saccharopolyspora]|uniref:NUDIX hydrolase n=1 Tax=Saccharopolyspora TaxID=1835 RepID=UPI001CD59B68|nr:MULTISPECIES: NUDIX hydrolase [Saccharopolyspora]MCA1187210.1 NUDIX hydrolase [Saccharopolyspora sp. 6T]MCA1194332.1 NUDIX hydrolase [Saccharopolyspora sp. 6V]MCA1227250.1 NUDIX hydrolase [Saccharopolyspora sp. 6M]MCA1283667.1 NUDIX hydrolase [Saccharopolyspora sp. 7B]